MNALQTSPKLEDILNHFFPGELIIAAARPGVGKTMLALDLSIHLARRKKSVAIFTLEIQKEMLTRRIVAQAEGVEFRKLSEIKVPFTSDHSSLLERFHIVDVGPLCVSDISSDCHEIVKTNGPLSLVVVDYLQLLRASNFAHEDQSSSAARETVLHELKQLAKELRCPILVASQLNCKIETQKNRRPQPKDIEQIIGANDYSDVYIGIYRDRYYDHDSPVGDEAEVHCHIRRSKEVFVTQLFFNRGVPRFENMRLENSSPQDFI